MRAGNASLQGLHLIAPRWDCWPMTSPPGPFPEIVVIDCAAICGDKSEPSSRLEHFGKIRRDMEDALLRTQDAINKRYKYRPGAGVSGKLGIAGFVLALVGIAPFLIGVPMSLLAAIGVPVPSYNAWSREHPLAANAAVWALFASIALMALAARLSARAKTVLANDPRPPVLLLRSFADEATAPRHADSFGDVTILEHALLRAVLRLGPFIAIGLPGEKVSYRGAGRAYYSEAEWRDAVLGFMERARCILLVAGDSPALVWEIEQVAARNYLGKTVIVLPPEADAERRLRRWEILQQRLPPLANVTPGSAHAVAAIYHAGSATVLVWSSLGLKAADYEHMLYVPFYELYGARQS
jgi:hypothetical protein